MKERVDHRQICWDYAEAYRLANNKLAQVTHCNGWYSVYTGGMTDVRYRRGKLLELTAALRERALESTPA